MANSGKISLILLLGLIGIVMIALAQPIAGDRWDRGNATVLDNMTGQKGIVIQGNATIVTVQGNMTIQVNTIQPQAVTAKDEANDKTKDKPKDEAKDEEKDDADSC